MGQEALPIPTLLRSALIILSMTLAGCVSLPDRDFTEPQLALARIDGIPAARFWSDDPMALAAARTTPLTRGRYAMLALSGGGDDGAYGAGFLNGWTRSGRRPEFAVVTGVSTGSLIAPFAFLGSDYDDRLTSAFTGIGPNDIYRTRFLLAIPFSTSAASTRPLEQLVERYFTVEVIDAVAREHRRGRRLLVGTANLDAQRGVIWNMGEIAASNSPERYALFRRVILASCSIPAVFPPVIIDSRSGGALIREAHIDGATVASLLAVPPALSASATPSVPGEVDLYLLVNTKLGGEFRLTRGGVFSIAVRAVSLATSSAIREQVSTAYQWSRRTQANFHLSFVDTDFDSGAPHTNFETAYMRRLFAYGETRGAAAQWLDRPPSGDPTRPAETPVAANP